MNFSDVVMGFSFGVAASIPAICRRPAGVTSVATGFLLPGWFCPSCRAFNGAAKEILKRCRCCGVEAP